MVYRNAKSIMAALELELLPGKIQNRIGVYP